ncbi:MAG: antibiotic biosynthesis monooxygenase [Candidatus Latescibacterota bacterium]|nr:MAG: antibiotic biosynthesis monooxygenase [Candidatus Latescibacterota bacterium]
MIARLWIGRTRAVSADAYREYILKTGVKDLRATKGNRGSWVFHRLEADQAEFIVISLWDTLKSIREFAGSDVEKARYYPEDDDYLLDKTETVTHYEVAHFS